MDGALKAIQEMESEGLQLYLCTSPVKGSLYCAQEKLNWIIEHLGEEWLDRAILCQDKVRALYTMRICVFIFSQRFINLQWNNSLNIANILPTLIIRSLLSAHICRLRWWGIC